MRFNQKDNSHKGWLENSQQIQFKSNPQKYLIVQHLPYVIWSHSERLGKEGPALGIYLSRWPAQGVEPQRLK